MRNGCLRLICLVGLVSPFAVPERLFAEDSYSLRESVEGGQVYSVSQNFDATGELETPTGDGRATGLKVIVKSVQQYDERRLAGTGRDHLGFRAARYYRQARATIDVDDTRSQPVLGDQFRFIVAGGQSEGVQLYSPSGAMPIADLDLLRVPGDSLAMLALLPDRNVELEEKWEQPSWAMQMFAGVDAVLKSELTCQLDSVKSDMATVSFEGSIEGATEGAATTVTVSGEYLFDLKDKYLKQMTLKQTEKRSVGPVGPGMEVTANVVVKRKPAGTRAELSDTRVGELPAQPSPETLLIKIETPNDSAQLLCDRDWHLFHQGPQATVIRLLDKGSFIAQCNLSRIPNASPGEHTPEEQFQADIRKALGEKLKSLKSAEQLVTDDGRFLYRVVAVGEANVPMHWIYYLGAAPTGEQISALFSIETELLDKLADRDLLMMSTLEFSKRSASAQRSATME